MLSFALDNFHNKFQEFYSCCEQATSAVKKEAEAKIHSAKNYMDQKYQATCQNIQISANKTKDFIYNNRETLFFIACATVTAVMAPHLFIPFTIATIVVRIELAKYLKNLANEYLKDDHNPYMLDPLYGPNYISTLDLTLVAIAAIDSIALGTIFLTSSLTIALLPAVGGIVVGSCIAKYSMDSFQSLSSTSTVPTPAQMPTATTQAAVPTPVQGLVQPIGQPIAA